MVKPAKNMICLWYDGDAEDAARFYAKTFPNSSVDAVHRAPGDFPSGKKGEAIYGLSGPKRKFGCLRTDFGSFEGS